MDVYATEQEQIEKIKKWWNENGKAIVLGLVLGVGGLFAYRYWESTQLKAGQSASINYDHLLGLASSGALDEASEAADAIIAGYPRSTYAKLSALIIAKMAVDANDIAAAKTRLQWVIENSKDGNLRPLAQSRLVQVLLAEGDTENAAATLATIAPRFDDQFSEIRGDLQAAQGDSEKARDHYAQAIRDAQERGVSAAALQLKLDNLALKH